MSLFKYQSSVRTCLKITNCEQYRTRSCAKIAATCQLNTTDILIKIRQSMKHVASIRGTFFYLCFGDKNWLCHFSPVWWNITTTSALRKKVVHFWNYQQKVLAKSWFCSNKPFFWIGCMKAFQNFDRHVEQSCWILHVYNSMKMINLAKYWWIEQDVMVVDYINSKRWQILMLMLFVCVEILRSLVRGKHVCWIFAINQAPQVHIWLSYYNIREK